MSHAIVLFQEADTDTWTKLRTVVFKARRTTYESVVYGAHIVELQHAVMARHTLILTDGETRVVVWPTGGNEPDETAPKTMFDLPVVGHYDIVGSDGEIFRIYHARHKNERRW